jgi:ATP-dependent helicase YprA (DUF1998 family)
MMQQTNSSISGALAAVAKAILGLLPMYVLCSSADVGIYWPRNDSELPLRMAVYDKTSSGGFTRAAFPRIREILQNLLFMANDNCFKDENVKILLLSRFLLGQQPKK